MHHDMREVRLRDMADADAETMIEIVRRCDPGIPDLLRKDLDRWTAAGKPGNEQYFVATIGGVVTGLVGYQPDVWGVADISWLVWGYVEPAFQRRGIGEMLFAHAEERLAARGCRKIYLDVGNASEHVAAISFHERRGYLREGYLRDYWCDGEDFLIFGKRLGS